MFRGYGEGVLLEYYEIRQFPGFDAALVVLLERGVCPLERIVLPRAG